jgi:SnoaL-like domain
VERFERGWNAPSPSAFDDFLADDVVLRQPLIPAVNGRAECHRYLARLLLFAPNLRGRLLSWAARDNELFLTVHMSAQVGRRSVQWTLVDRVRFDDSGMMHERQSFFDPSTLAWQIGRSPRLTFRWFWSRAVRNPVARFEASGR